MQKAMAVDLDADGNPLYEVEAILGKRINQEYERDAAGKAIRGKGIKTHDVVRYLMRWVGCASDLDSWERSTSIQAPNLIADYERGLVVDTSDQRLIAYLYYDQHAV